jgi:hypothetical protein
MVGLWTTIDYPIEDFGWGLWQIGQIGIGQIGTSMGLNWDISFELVWWHRSNLGIHWN